VKKKNFEGEYGKINTKSFMEGRKTANMEKQTIFGKLSTGEIANKYILENSNGMQITVSNFGALVLSIMVKDKAGVARDVVQGFEKLEDYFQTDTGMGAYVGRNANRIQGASVSIDGITYTLDANNGRNNLHSGFDRSHCKIYEAKWGEDSNGAYVEFYRISPHLEQGFPGNLEQKIRYTLTDDNEFVIDYEMVSDRTTIVNPTNHSYFNLDGHNCGTVLQHELEVYADTFLETDEELIPTGKIVDVTHTPMDFRNRKQIGKDMDSDYLPLRIANGYDHNYIFENDRILKKVAKLYAADSGICMTVMSDLCGLQIYSGNFLQGEAGKDGAVYHKNSGICLETQFYPNACNEKSFPSPLLEAGKKFTSRTVYRFET